MLGIFGNKSDHPLSSLKSVQQIAENLPGQDMVAVLEEIGHWIEVLLDEENGFRIDHQYSALRILDEAAHPYLRKVINAYYAAAPLTAFQENRLWSTLDSYYTIAERAYHNILINVRAGEKGASSLKSSIALICARGIYSIFGKMECASVRYMKIEPWVWEHLADMYDHAAVERCQSDELITYAGGSDTSVDRMFASVVMWHSIAAGAMRPLELHIARCVIVHLRKYLSVTDQPRAESMFIFDLANPVDPARAKEEGAMYPPSTRFVSINVPAAYFEDMRKTLSKDIVPEEFNFGVTYSPIVVGDVMQRISSYCKLPLPSRRHQRRKVKMNVRIVNGFGTLLNQAEEGAIFEGDEGETCEVEDISASGIKYIIPASRAAGVKIGSLIGLQPDKAGHWGAGVVKRLRRDEKNNLHVGVRILANRVSGVVMQDGGGLTDGSLSALLIERNDDSSGENWLLMRSETFSSSRSPMMKHNGREYLMMPLGLIEKGVDFDLVRYRKMVHESGTEG